MRRFAAMVMDRDYPMTRRQVTVMVAGLLIMTGIGIALFGGYLPGIHPKFSTVGLADLAGHQYHVFQTFLHVPLWTNYSAPWNVTFDNISFVLWVTNWYSPQGAVVHGMGSEPNGTSYLFAVGNLLPNGTRVTLYLSPDYEFGAYWVGGFAAPPWVQLLVQV